MLPDTAPLGGTQGVDPAIQISPTVALPFGTPFTLQVTAVSGEFVTVARNAVRCPALTVAEAGETDTATLLVIVIEVDAI